MKSPFGDKRDPELQARDAIRRKKWSKAIAHYERKLQDNERDFALWNLLGDLHLNNRHRAQAVDAWRRALEGFALEGLHENVLGIARKILRRTPEEEDVNLVMAEAFLGLEYHADCLTALRTYLKMAKHRSEADLRSLFKKILESEISHAHLLEELQACYNESGVDDLELARRVSDYVDTRLKAVKPKLVKESPQVETIEEEAAIPTGAPVINTSTQDGLLTLDGMDSYGEDLSGEFGYRPPPAYPGKGIPDYPSGAESSTISDLGDTPDGEGKDHYDLGMVYKEMKLWDAAVAELEQARRDPSLRLRATMGLAECLQESHDLQGALELLESEEKSADVSPQERLGVRHQLGIVNELLGNLDEALRHYDAIIEVNPGYADVELRISDLRSKLVKNS